MLEKKMYEFNDASATWQSLCHLSIELLYAVSSATFLTCAIAAAAPVVLVSRSSVASSSSPTGASA